MISGKYDFYIAEQLKMNKKNLRSQKMKNSFFFSITNNDGKYFEENVEEVYFTSFKKGDHAILNGSEDLVVVF